MNAVLAQNWLVVILIIVGSVQVFLLAGLLIKVINKPRWVYKSALIGKLAIRDALNQAEQGGWELVSMTPHQYDNQRELLDVIIVLKKPN